MATTYCDYEICKNCDNNSGGVCAYDHDAEAKETLLCDAKQIVSNARCLLFDPAQKETYEEEGANDSED